MMNISTFKIYLFIFCLCVCLFVCLFVFLIVQQLLSKKLSFFNYFYFSLHEGAKFLESTQSRPDQIRGPSQAAFVSHGISTQSSDIQVRSPFFNMKYKCEYKPHHMCIPQYKISGGAVASISVISVYPQDGSCVRCCQEYCIYA